MTLFFDRDRPLPHFAFINWIWASAGDILEREVVTDDSARAPL